MDELADPNVTQNVDVTAIDTPVERTPFPSFSNFIYQPPQENNPDVAAFRALVPSTSAVPPQSSVNEFVTSSDLAALERRMQVMVSEVTTAVSSRLFEQFSMTPTVTTGATTLAETSGTNLDSSLVFSPTSISEDQPTPPPGRLRRDRRQLRARDRVPPHDPQGDPASASKRPRPRLQLTGSMYKKHPVFKFFVTAPGDSENHPHKWRCRVCHIELSLKTKRSLEILSHYRTDSHLVREHRIRMETPGLPLFGKDEQELTGPALVEAREKAELAYPIIPTLGECYLLPGQRKLPVAIDELDPSSVVCSQIRILLTGLQQGGDSTILSSLWSNLSLEVRGPVKVP